MAARSARRLDGLVDSKALTPDGKDWLIAALDPFHDTKYRLAGFPEMSVSLSEVQLINLTETIEMPSALPSTAKSWDLHLFNVPMHGGADLTGANPGQPRYFTPHQLNENGTLTHVSDGGPNCYSGFSGAASVGYDGTWTGSGVVAVGSGLALPPKFASGRYRVIGQAYEIHNTTAPLYKSGSCTTYRKPAQRLSSFARTEANPVTSAGFLEIINGPAASLSEAAQYPNSQTWSAADGAYVVCTLNNIDNPVVGVRPGWTFMSRNGNYFTDGTKSFVDGVGIRTGSAAAWHFDLAGTILTGLSPETKLTVNVRYLVQRFPDESNVDLLVTAGPSPGADALALELYSRALKSLPVAVRVGENPLGEWFNHVLDAVIAAGPAIATAVPHPVVKAAALGATGVASAIRASRTPAPAVTATQEPPRAGQDPSIFAPTVVTTRTRTRRSRRAGNPYSVQTVATNYGNPSPYSVLRTQVPPPTARTRTQKRGNRRGSRATVR